MNDTQTIQPTKIVHFGYQTGRYFSNVPGDQTGDYVPLADFQALARQLEASTIIKQGGLTLDVARRTVRWLDGAEIKLRPLEYDLLAYLMQRPNETLLSSTLITEVWRGKVGTTNNVHVHICYVRNALTKAGAPKMILTDPGKGFRFVPCDAEFLHLQTESADNEQLLA